MIPKFIIDMNCGKLTPWLRALGYDVLFINPIDDGPLVELALEEGRIVVTKDGGIMQRRLVTSGQVKAIKVEGEDWKDQLKQLSQCVRLSHARQFTRCLECNTLLEPRTQNDARDHVPAKIARMYHEFQFCPSCGQYFWKGTHWERMRLILSQIIKGS